MIKIINNKLKKTKLNLELQIKTLLNYTKIQKEV